MENLPSAAYAGVGARKTPPDILLEMKAIAASLAQYRTLRSGGATGADEAFYKGCGMMAGRFEIFLPEERFNGFISQTLFDGSFITHEISPQAYKMAKKLHKGWSYMNDFGKAAHARNCHQILGANLNSPVDFVVCWTPNGEEVGGTATAIKLAKSYGIKVINMGAKGWEESMSDTFEWLSSGGLSS